MQHEVTMEEWVERLRAIGVNETAMLQWHKLFESENPAGHQSFLQWLGVSAEKITEIRRK